MKSFIVFLVVASVIACGYATAVGENVQQTTAKEEATDSTKFDFETEIRGTIDTSFVTDEPVKLEDVDSGVEKNPTVALIRNRRLTCDFFSFSSSHVTPNHAACATKCMGMGRKGGSCHGTNCVCRNDKWVG
ncbi:uncharacterized protein LOC107041554 isoform X2 [Diachasma alloeum]|uniref:uncharacterized protein LOC107041554 isoform X2 n=1 Tax=Diachasma alloeum TaxID=454923 RepID=UPI0007384F4D|nr:uncharacterized protein LOC107041554 isoform X2 [Diachasma alloeum]